MEDSLNTLTITRFGRQVTVALRTGRYEHGNGLAVELIDVSDGEPYAALSVNVPGIPLADNQFIFKTYSENEGLLEELLKAGVVEVTGPIVTGMFADIGPICRLLLPPQEESTRRNAKDDPQPARRSREAK